MLTDGGRGGPRGWWTGESKAMDMSHGMVMATPPMMSHGMTTPLQHDE